MTSVRRPIHLQLRPVSAGQLAPTCSPIEPNQPSTTTSPVTSPCDDSMPSQILPHLFVGNQEQTNRDTVNKLNISYILSLGLLPLISNSMSPVPPPSTATTKTPATTATNNAPHQNIVLPSRNSSRDFKIPLRTGTTSATSSTTTTTETSCSDSNNAYESYSNPTKKLREDHEENKNTKAIRQIQCKCINIADNSEQSLTKFFDEAHQFIDEARRKKCNILVHCLAGISRSPTIAIAYLMRVNSLRLQDAYNLVKQCRPQIDVNLSFMGQLMVYGKRLLTSCCRPIPRQPADSSNLAINMNPCDKNHVNNSQQSADNATNLMEEQNSDSDLSHIIFICKQ